MLHQLFIVRFHGSSRKLFRLLQQYNQECAALCACH